jgi:hypothetical protein
MTFQNHLAGREAYRTQREYTPDAALKARFADRRVPISRPDQPVLLSDLPADIEGNMLAAYFAGTPAERAEAEAWLNALPFGTWEHVADPAPVAAVEPCYTIPFDGTFDLTDDDDAPFRVRPDQE